MKKDILILAALIAVVIAVPFLATKAEEAIQIKNEEFKEKQNRTLLAGHTGKKDTGHSVQIYVV